MHSTTTYPDSQPRFGSIPSIAAKFFIAAGILSYAFYHISIGHLMLVVLFCGLLLAFLNRIENINSTETEHHKRATESVCFDGGSYNRNQQAKPDLTSSPTVNDGGSFERSSLKI